MTREEALKRAWRLAGMAEKAIPYVDNDGARVNATAQVAMVYVALADALTLVPLSPNEGDAELPWEVPGEPVIGRVPPLDTGRCVSCGASIMDIGDGDWRHVTTGDSYCRDAKGLAEAKK